MAIEEKENRVINRINPKIMFSLIFSYLLLIIALQSALYVWISAISVLFVLWRFMFQQRKTNLPTNTVLNVLALVCIGLIGYFSLEGGVLNGMTNLLLLATSMKLLALNRVSEVKNLCLALYFAIASSFIFKQGIGYSVFIVTIFVINTYTLLMLYTPGLNMHKRLRFGFRFLLTCIPLTLFLFAMMPRLGPLWKMPTAKGQTTGLSETISPGDFSDLAQSSKLAFRVAFDGPIPANQDLYWRTMVHEQFDGKQWAVHRIRKTAQNITQPSAAKPPFAGEPVMNYQVITEPTFQQWLYSLDTPISYDGELNYHFDRRLTSKLPISQKFQYQVSSMLRHQDQHNLHELERQINLLYPRFTNQRTIELAKRLRQQYPQDMDYVKAVLSYYIDQAFIYTLEPPLMPSHPVDQFLFDAKAGFCSHFASSFALLMRVAGIPARVVSGFQGGERSDDDEFVSVYQYEAHAWNEVYIDGKGWLRFDPTATVSPERIAQGLQAAMLNEQSFLSDEMFSLVKYRQFALVNWLRNQMNNMDFLWATWVLNFDSKKQNELFESLWGKQDATTYGLYISLLFTAFIAFIYLLSRGRPIKQDYSALARLHQRTLVLGKLYDFERPVSLAPMSYLDQLISANPQLETPLQQLKQYYQSCFYQDLSPQQFQATLTKANKLIKQLKRQAPDQLKRLKLALS